MDINKELYNAGRKDSGYADEKFTECCICCKSMNSGCRGETLETLPEYEGKAFCWYCARVLRVILCDVGQFDKICYFYAHTPKSKELYRWYDESGPHWEYR